MESKYYGQAFWLVSLVLTTIGLSGCGGPEGEHAAVGKSIIKVATVLPADHPSTEALDFFKRRMAEVSGETIEVRIFPNGQLGSATEALEALRAGNLEMTMASVAPLASFVPEVNVLSMPFIFRSKPHEYAVLDGAVGQRLTAGLAANDFVTLSFFDAGSRNIMTKPRPVTTPEDLKGLKIRVMSSKLMVDTINALGASATPMSQGEVYSALQTGVIDGWENNPQTALSFKMYETGCIYFSWTRHLAVPDFLLVSKAYYDGLSEQQREWLDQVGRETTMKQRELWQASTQESIQALKAAGMEFNEVANRQALIDQVEGLYEEYYEKHGAEFREICEQIRAVEAED